MAKDIRVIHPTTLSKLDCRLQYHWSRNYKTRMPATALTFGIAIHEALEDYYAGTQTLLKAFAKHGGTLAGTSDFDLGMAMLTNYLAEYHGKENFKVLSTEQEIARKIPMPDDEDPKEFQQFYVGARIDAIVVDPQINQIMVLEHKTFETFYPASLDMDIQFLLEMYIAEGFLKKPVRGVIYNGLRKKAKSNTVKLFERHRVFINAHQVKVALHRIYWTLKEVYSGDFKIFPEPGALKCNMCPFKQPCTEYMRGGDYQFILDNAYDAKKESDTEWQ